MGFVNLVLAFTLASVALILAAGILPLIDIGTATAAPLPTVEGCVDENSRTQVIGLDSNVPQRQVGTVIAAGFGAVDAINFTFIRAENDANRFFTGDTPPDLLRANFGTLAPRDQTGTVSWWMTYCAADPSTGDCVAYTPTPDFAINTLTLGWWIYGSIGGYATEEGLCLYEKFYGYKHNGAPPAVAATTRNNVAYQVLPVISLTMIAGAAILFSREFMGGGD